MIDLETLIAFTLLNMSFALIPGPDVLCILFNSIAHGARAGVKVCLGIACGALFHVACATLGLTALLLAVPSAFAVVKFCGAAYLAWLGWQMLRRPVSPMPIGHESHKRSPFLQGAVSNVLNPKVALFFVAVLPQFVVNERGAVTSQIFLLGLLSIGSGTLINLITATLGARARALLLGRERLFRGVQRMAGAALIGIGLRVALDRTR